MDPNAQDLKTLISQAQRVLAQLEAYLPAVAPATNWQHIAFRWRKTRGSGWLEGIPVQNLITPESLQHIDQQKTLIERNTLHFLQGKPANNVLMTGARGTGKSSLVKAMLQRYSNKGLRLIEVDRDDLIDLADIIQLISIRPEKFIIFCDDLSFEQGEATYKNLKSILDGNISAQTQNVLIYATSNRRHLMPEYMSDNLGTSMDERGELHPREGVEEKISLSERFGLWVSFYPFDQDSYLSIVEHWLIQLGCPQEVIAEAKPAALQWALSRGSRSGRVAWQFAKDWVAQLN